MATVTGAADDWATELAGLRVESDPRSEKIGYKLREHTLQKLSVQIALGGREAEERTVTRRCHGADKTRTMPLNAAAQALPAAAQPPYWSRFSGPTEPA
ncbi:His/Gly/Thr/Pro-type tRNA ligase C-terminal domain-containing protein [Salipiger sp. 1_MG-2023]|uniref:His/Gly/Thr/Pro-type tRNA ligase C-terminal domain-containing protein n=1 Tax=Salipiger sp. 1_MG-2023 TaxID=3062665 RepID=UPI0026E2F7DC|nr:His/Gly/Thr/Pro-type tRNA ligase C-terminal domain-containing protein [Salipiger sp. 1_MG-2023]MDO6588262.1 His/Gly/Thr/Pro-type tRNA ligase C-terminal domain-containing protein [Salipiger sp. 1_MG-2023]